MVGLWQNAQLRSASKSMTSEPQIGCELGIARAVTSLGPQTGRRTVLAASCVGCCLVFVSGAVINVALAAIGRDLGLDARALQWMINAELLPLAALTLVAGALGDRFGQKRVFLAGIALFGIASLGCAFALNGRQLVFGRLLQGVGDALILPTGLTILGQAFPSERKGWAVGLWSASAAVASAVAPTVAGLILDHGSWRGAFLMQVPLAGVAFILAAMWVPKAPGSPHSPIDLAAAGLSVTGLGALGWSLMALTDGAVRPLFLVMGASATVLAFTTLGVVELRRGDRAMLPPALFAARTVIALNLFSFMLYGAFTATLTLVPFVMIKGAHLSALLAGVAFVRLQTLITAVSPLAGVLCARFGHSLPLAIRGAGDQPGMRGCTEDRRRRALLDRRLPHSRPRRDRDEPGAGAHDNPGADVGRRAPRRDGLRFQRRRIASRLAVGDRLARRRPSTVRRRPGPRVPCRDAGECGGLRRCGGRGFYDRTGTRSGSRYRTAIPGGRRLGAAPTTLEKMTVIDLVKLAKSSISPSGSMAR
jgi:MFS family permease